MFSQNNGTKVVTAKPKTGGGSVTYSYACQDPETLKVLLNPITKDTITFNAVGADFNENGVSIKLQAAVRLYITFLVQGVTVTFLNLNNTIVKSFSSTNMNIGDDFKQLVGDFPTGDFRIEITKTTNDSVVDGLSLFRLTAETGNNASLSDWLLPWADDGSGIPKYWQLTPEGISCLQDSSYDENLQPTFIVASTFNTEYFMLCSARAKRSGLEADASMHADFISIEVQGSNGQVTHLTPYVLPARTINTYGIDQGNDGDVITIGWVIPTALRGTPGNYAVKITLAPVGIRQLSTFNEISLHRILLESVDQPLIPTNAMTSARDRAFKPVGMSQMPKGIQRPPIRRMISYRP